MEVEKLKEGNLGERHKAINLMVRNANENVLSADNIIQNLTDKSQIDLIYKARLANHTKNGLAVCELLKSKDDKVVSVILQSKWFFTGKTHPEMVNLEYFKKEIFPFVSYHTLCRIVSNLSAYLDNEIVAEDFYNYFYTSYSENLAVKLLPKCRSDFIRRNIMECLIEIPCLQLYFIYKKDKYLAVEYLDAHLKKEKQDRLPANYKWKYDYMKVLRQIAEDDQKMFVELMDKHYQKVYYIKIGSKIANQIVKKYLDDIIADPFKFPYLNKKVIVGQLKTEEQLYKYFANFLPNDYKFHHGSICNSGFECLKPELQLKILNKIYPQKYNTSILDIDDLGNFNFYSYLSVEDRVKWVQNQIAKIKPEDKKREVDFVKYLEAKEAFTRYQSLCNASDCINDRLDYLNKMIECCTLNRDNQSLLKFLKYVSNRHQNDTLDLKYSYLTKIFKTCNLQDFTVEHWQELHKIIEFICCKPKSKENYTVYSIVTDYDNEYIKYCVRKNLDFELYLDRLIHFTRHGLTFELKLLDLKVGNLIFEKYKRVVDEKINSNCQDDVNISFEKVYELIQLLKKNNKCMSESNKLCLLNFIKDNYTKWPETEIIKLFSEMKKIKSVTEMFTVEFCKFTFDVKLAQYYLKHKPHILMEHSKRFVEKSVVAMNDPGNNRYIFNPIAKKCCKIRRVYEKIFTYLMDPIGNQIMNATKSIMTDENSTDIQDKAFGMTLLCYLLPSDSTKAMLEDHSPPNLKVQNIEEESETYNKAEILAKYLGTINPPVDYQTLLLFLGGDYLKYSLGSLFRLVRRKPLPETKEFIHSLIDKPISLKKHFVHLSNSLYPRNELLPLYKSLWNKEKNPSMRNVLFTFTFHLMRTENDLQRYNEMWNILKCFIETFIETDKDLFKYLTEPGSIKRHIMNEYCAVCWTKLKLLSEENVDVSRYFTKIVRNLHIYVQSLNDEFCETIIYEYLYSLGKTNMKYKIDKLVNFMVDYVLGVKSHDVQNKHIEMISRYYKNFIKNNWNTTVDGEYKHRESVKNLVLIICKRSLVMELQLNPTNLLKTLVEMLSCLPIEAAFRFIILIKLTIHFKEELEINGVKNTCDLSDDVRNKITFNFGHRLAIYYNELISELGKDIIHAFETSYSEFQSGVLNLYPNSSITLHTMRGLLDNDSESYANTMLVATIFGMESCYFYDQKEQELYNQTITELMSKKNLLINVLLKNNFVTQEDIIQ